MKAFTLVEILIVIGAMMILTGLASLSLVNSGKSTDVNSGVTVVTTALKEARANSQADVNDKAWGVHFETTRVVIYADSGSGYIPGDSGNVYRLIENPLTLSWNLTGGSANVLFAKRTGDTANSGTITVSGQATANQTITINSEGMVD